MAFGGFLKKIFGVGLEKISPTIKNWVQRLLTSLMDFLEKHFNNIIKHLFGIGGAGLVIGEVVNLSQTIMDGAVEKFGFFSRVLGIQSVFNSVNSSLTPYMTNWNCSFMELFASFGGVAAINTILNSFAYAILFWLAIIIFKWIVGLIPVLLQMVAKI